METNKTMVRNVCPKCKDEVIKHQKFIVYCEDCRCEMERFPIEKPVSQIIKTSKE